MRERIYVPTERKEGEHYASFEEMIAARPDVLSENTTLEVPYSCMDKDEYETGKLHTMIV